MIRIRTLAMGALLAATAVAPLAAQVRPDAPRRAMAGEPGSGRALFRGIALTEQEKASLKAIRDKYQPQMQQLRQQLQPQMQEAMKARRSGDTTAARAAWQKTEAQREQVRALVQKMEQESRNALTPEHRAQFDSNAARAKARMERMAAGRPGMRPGARGDARGQGRGRFQPGRGARPARDVRGRPGAHAFRAAAAERLNLSDAEKAKVKAVREKYAPQVKALREEAQKDRAATKAKAQELHKKMHDEVRAQLTPEHQKQLDSLKARRPRR